jgi:hypothetical protein
MKSTDTPKVVLPTESTSGKGAGSAFAETMNLLIKQHFRMMKTPPIAFLSVLILANAVPVILNAASLSLSKGELKDSDPAAFFIYKGKLYICSTADGAKEFRSNINENIRKADENWVPLSRAQGQPYNRGPR